jgi:hypothetical protein
LNAWVGGGERLVAADDSSRGEHDEAESNDDGEL